MTTFKEDEDSVEDSLPEEYWRITHGTFIYHIAVGNRDLQIGNTLYTATASARSEIKISAAGSPQDLELTLPVNHPLILRYLQWGIPPRSIEVTVTRRQTRSQEDRQLWSGRITSVAPGGALAKLRVPARTTETMLRQIPNYTVGRTCPHLLYSPPCGISKDAALFKLDATAISVSGRDVRFDIGDTDHNNWSRGGVLIHLASGERMTIRSQIYLNSPYSSVVEISLHQPIYGMKAGDLITVHPGCDHTMDDCHVKFNNRQNHGGQPHLPTKNPFVYKNRIVR